MAYCIIDDEEDLPLEMPDQTRDGKRGVLYYRRMDYDTHESLMALYGRDKAGNPATKASDWADGNYKKFERDAIEHGYREKADNFVIQRRVKNARGSFDLVETAVVPTKAQVLRMPQDFRAKLVSAIVFSEAPFRAQETPEEEAARKAKLEAEKRREESGSKALAAVPAAAAQIGAALKDPLGNSDATSSPS